APATTAPAAKAGAKAAAPAKKGYSALNPKANATQAAKVGALIKPQSSDYGGSPNTWAGVTKDTIKTVFSIDASSCGVNTINAISQAGANLSNGDRYSG